MPHELVLWWRLLCVCDGMYRHAIGLEIVQNVAAKCICVQQCSNYALKSLLDTDHKCNYTGMCTYTLIGTLTQ
jgi:hypothetical protein